MNQKASAAWVQPRARMPSSSSAAHTTLMMSGSSSTTRTWALPDPLSCEELLPQISKSSLTKRSSADQEPARLVDRWRSRVIATSSSTASAFRARAVQPASSYVSSIQRSLHFVERVVWQHRIRRFSHGSRTYLPALAGIGARLRAGTGNSTLPFEAFGVSRTASTMPRCALGAVLSDRVSESSARRLSVTRA